MTTLQTPHDAGKIIPFKILYVSHEEARDMKGKTYRYGDKFRIYFRGDWFYRDEHGKLLYSERSAFEFLEHLNQLLRDKQYDPSYFKKRSPYKFDEAWETYYQSVVNDSEWYRGKKSIYQNHLKPFFKNCDIREIRKIHIQGLVNAMRQGGSGDKRIKDALGVLHAMLRYFSESLAIFPAFPEHSYQKPRIKWLTEKEIAQIFEFILSEDMPIFCFLRDYAVRPEEACGLLRSKVNWETRTIDIDTVFVQGRLKNRTKQNRAHGLPIIPELEECLRGGGSVEGYHSVVNSQGPTDREKTVKLVHSTSIFIFTDHRGEPYNTRKLQTRWRRAMKRAVEKYQTRVVTLYKLRHSWASQRRRQGFKLEDIQAWLGHSDMRVTQEHYADIGAGELVSIGRGRK